MTASVKRALRIGLTVLVVLIAVAAITLGGCVTLSMPGESFDGVRPALTAAEQEVSARLKADVIALATEIGRRNAIETPDELEAAAKYVESQLAAAGFATKRQEYALETNLKQGGAWLAVKGTFANLEAELAGTTRASEIVVLGAHYDSVLGSRGADDNASGVATLLALARALGGKTPERTVRFVAFVNEEPPFWHSPTTMGSRLYAQRCKDRSDDVVAMLSLETLGFFSDAPDSQHYPFPLSLVYPSTGDFVAFVGNRPSVESMQRTVEAFRRVAKVPSYGAAASFESMSFSDHRSFWETGYPGFMVTDTAFFRNASYHEASDLPESLDYDRLAQVVSGLVEALKDLAGIERTAVEL